MTLENTATDALSPAREADGLSDPGVRIIRPSRRRLRLRDLPGQAEVVRVLAARDFKVKYKQSILGPLWLVFQPLALLAAFIVAFSRIADVSTGGVPYAVFALAGLVPWTFFQAAMTIGTASVLTNANFVRFTPCPRPAFPIASLIASLPAFVVTAAGAVVLAAASGVLGVRAVLIPVGLVWLFVLTAGVVAICAALAVRYRDIPNALPFFLQLGVFFAPIGYSLDGLSTAMRVIVDLNPLTGVIEAFRWMLVDGYEASFEPLAASLGLTAILALVGWRVFTAFETTMADEI